MERRRNIPVDVALRRSIALALAPRFQSQLAWSDRVQINGGVEVADGRVYPRQDWRRPRDAELELLLANGERPRITGRAGAPSPGLVPGPTVLSPSHVGLIQLPPHLRREWWDVADREGALAGDGERYGAFARGVIDFLTFKRVPLPDRCRVEVAVSRPGQPSTRWDDAAGCPQGLDWSCARGSADTAAPRVAGIVNLGDEPTHVVFLNLAPPEMDGMLGAPGPGAAAPDRDLLRRFFATLPAYPLIRVRLEAGDGLWLPARGLAYDVCTLDKREVDVALTIHGGG